MLALLRRSFPDTPLPSLQDALRTAIAIGVAVLLTGVFSAWLAPVDLAPVLVASMGASAIILLVLPTSPLAQPWPLVGGQMISFIIGISVARWISWPLAACGLAMLLSAIAMLRLHCLHPPGGAAALIPILAHHPNGPSFGYGYLLVPVAINLLFLLLLAWGFNRLLGRSYPHRPLPAPSNPHGTSDPPPTQRVGLQDDDVLAVLAEQAAPPDIGASELRRLMARAEYTAVHRVFGGLDCAAVMSREVVAVSPKQPAGDAWRLLRQHKLRTLPVLEPTGRLVGMIALVDFLKHIPLAGLQQDAHALAAWLTGRPELEPLVEDVMTAWVQTVRDDQSLLDLVPLLSDAGLHHLPVVDAGGRLVGMITQSDLIAGLHWELTRGAMGRLDS